MNSTRQAILDTLKAGDRYAVDLHGALRLGGFKGGIEDVYVELVAMEAIEQVRATPLAVDGRNTYVWGLGRALVPRAPAFEPTTRMVDDLLRVLGTPTDLTSPPPAGVTVHRIR